MANSSVLPPSHPANDAAILARISILTSRSLFFVMPLGASAIYFSLRTKHAILMFFLLLSMTERQITNVIVCHPSSLPNIYSQVKCLLMYKTSQDSMILLSLLELFTQPCIATNFPPTAILAHRLLHWSHTCSSKQQYVCATKS